jgi:phytoene synthase
MTGIAALASLQPERVAAGSRSSFLVSFGALAPERRAALTAVYAFCRVVDDAVDEAVGQPRADAAARLAFWRAELERAANGAPASAIGRALQRAMREYGVAPADLEQVLAGVAQDLDGARFATFAELEAYCRRVASAVGLACLPILGASERARAYADQLGIALQLVNVLRDLATDAAAGRVYVSADLLAACGVDPAWLDGRGPAPAYAPGGPVARLVQRLASLARERFARARAALPQAERARLLAPAIMAAVYEDLLARVVARGGNLRGPRARVPAWRKLWLAWRVRRAARR